jgi:hypoxanthine phosphoribosyltransferase
MSHYQHQIHCAPQEIDIEFWKRPEGVSVPEDELQFLLVPDVVEALACFELAGQVHAYQRAQSDQDNAITRALMVTVGGMLPGVLLHDHLVEGRPPGTPLIEFGTIGVSLYAGPGVRYDKPRVKHGISIPINDATVLTIDDLGDGGGTLQFLAQHLREAGARQVLNLALYMKPQALQLGAADFWFGELPQDTWIITPRELVETMIKRVPVWRERGANQEECYRRLVDIIGYPPALVQYYLPGLFA